MKKRPCKESAQPEHENKTWYLRGLRDGIPIGLGYFAVGFTLGIAAREAGITAFQMGLMSLLMHASAGQFAVITIIAGQSGYVAMILTQIVINIRYLLMSCSLSQKISPSTSNGKRMLLAYFVTDEIFGIAASVKGTLNPFYNYGAATVASPGWILGTALGVLVGNILPASMISALSVALYGMFLAVVIPAAKGDRVVAAVVIASMAGSCVFSWIPVLKGISGGTKIIILTVVIAAAAAIIRPAPRMMVCSKNKKNRRKHNGFITEYIYLSAGCGIDNLCDSCIAVNVDTKRDPKHVYPLFLVLCTLCDTGCHDISCDHHGNRDSDFGCGSIYCSGSCSVD